MTSLVSLSPLLCLTAALLVFCCALACLLLRPSAKRTILLTTPLLQQQKLRTVRKGKPAAAAKDPVNPIYWWMVQPRAETGLTEGRFTLSRSSQRTVSLETLRRSSSVLTESSSGLSRASSLTSAASSLATTSEAGEQQQPRPRSFLHSFFKPPAGSS